MRAPVLAWTLFLVVLLCANTSFSQEYHDYGFARTQNMAVQSSDGQPLLFPWCGGLNSVRFSEIDLNGDGVKDLVAFEKHGNRLLPFLNAGIADSICYTFAPEYASRFPMTHDWLVLKDYNGDGLEDVFTYGLAGITVYKNVSDENGLQFALVTEQLQSFYYNDSTNLYTSPDDYLALEDLDGDGDLDILNFWLLGKYVHFHRNYSMEDFGDAEHFSFRLEDECWGHFEEGGEDNSILLNSPCGRKDEPTRHIGSTLFVRDISGNGLPDLVLGDIDFPNLIYLRNGGSLSDAQMVAQDTLFPNVRQPIWLYSMPVVNFVDVDNDGFAELLASPSDPSLTKSQDLQSVWMYHIDEQHLEYEKVTESFLQDEMVDVGSGARPVLYDWNGDGLLDIFVSNYGSYDSSALVSGFLTSYYSSSISYFQNVGTANDPAFRLITNDFGNLKHFDYQSVHPAFGDLDGDGSTDLILGLSDGTLRKCRNRAAVNELPDFEEPEVMSGMNVGDYATPQLFDLDNDGHLDLLIGNRRGRIAYYRNVSLTNNAEFQFVTDTLGGVDVRDAEISFFGYCVPYFYRNSSQATVLFCGNEQGNVCYYDQIDNNLTGAFRLRERLLMEGQGSALLPIAEGFRSAPALADLNADGFLDMLVGNYAGGLTLFMGTTPPPVSIENAASVIKAKVYPNPATDYFYLEMNEMESAQVNIYDLSGRIVFAQTLHLALTKINVADWTSGIYVGTVVSDNKLARFKLVVAGR